jgi:hypothetical protein
MRTLLSSIKALMPYRGAVAQKIEDRPTIAYRVPEELTVEVDANGSPVTVPEAYWLVCFVPGLQRQWWHRFANEKHKHVFAMRPLEDGTWLLLEPWWTRLMVNVLTLDEAMKFLRWGAAGDILRVRERIPGCGSQARGWANCAVQISYMLGRSYWTWSPHGLFRKLMSEADTERIDFSQLLSEHLEFVTQRNVKAAMGAIPQRGDAPLDQTLLRLGTAVVSIMMSPWAIALYRAVVSDASRFKCAATVYWTRGPMSAIKLIREALEDALHRDGVTVEDTAFAARQFIAMLRGSLQLEVVFGVRVPPNPVEIHLHVSSVVATFLRRAAVSESRPLKSCSEANG